MRNRYRLVRRFQIVFVIAIPLVFMGVGFLYLNRLVRFNGNNGSRISKDGQTMMTCGEQKLDKSLVAHSPATGGIYMKDTDEERSPVKFLLRPTAAERIMLFDLAKWSMVYLVKSAIYNKERRDAIRETWASVKVFDGAIFQIVFILGKSKSESVNREINIEASRHGDILLCDELDSSQFVAEKVLAGMQWASEVLPTNWLYSSIDDDIVVNPLLLTKYLAAVIDDHTTPRGEICFDDLPMACVYNYQPKDSPSREEDSKWYMSPENYPGDYWPVYCRGGMYTTSSKMVKDLFEKSKKTAHLYLDDVWITGFIRRKLNKGDYNIMAPPMSVMTDKETYKDKALEDLLVKHLWGNVENIEVHVPSKLRDVWAAFEPKIKDKMRCTT
ncbi:beta-1,3-galactosyltransferase 5-like [Clavelina lepadiformis]|uniref:beta-1,3-galactosyltransferase 5-like n=1 Tax=Clavelina lepadiformis TaxID=159417 RepID=UPI0040436E38